jgi:hypothetical protein
MNNSCIKDKALGMFPGALCFWLLADEIVVVEQKKSGADKDGDDCGDDERFWQRIEHGSLLLFEVL